MIVNLWLYRGLIIHNAVADLRHRYRGSIAGYLWNAFIPLAQIVVFSVIFSTLMGWRLEQQGYTGRLPFVVYLCSGLLAWNAFADTLMRGVSSFVGNSNYLKKLPVPEQLFVAIDACSGFLSGLIAIGLFLLFSIFVAHHGPFLEWLQVIPVFALFIGFAFGLGLMLSCLNVFFRDIQPLMNVLILLWFWLTPIVYDKRIFEGRRDWMLDVLPFNPAFHFIEAFHDAIFQRQWISPSTWAFCLLATFAANAIGYATLRALRPSIRDVL